MGENQGKLIIRHISHFLGAYEIKQILCIFKIQSWDKYSIDIYIYVKEIGKGP